MSEANLKQALRKLINDHIEHVTQLSGNANTKPFQNVLKKRIASMITSEMRVRHLLNKKYVTNVNKNQIVSRLKNTNIANPAALNNALKKQGYVLSPSANGKQRISQGRIQKVRAFF
jgi:hypothetical protein